MRHLEVSTDQPGHLNIQAHGDWTAPHADQIESQSAKILAETQSAKSAEINLTDIKELDTYGAWLIERLQRDLVAIGTKTTFKNVKAKNAPLLKQVNIENFPLKTQSAASSNKPDLLARMDKHIGAALKGFFQFFTMLGALLAALGQMIIHPKQYRLTSTIYQLDRVIWQALPIVLMVTFIIGAIIAQQGFFHFRKFGADLYVVDMIGFLIMREIGVLLVAIVIAGRSGSSYTAELGSMKMREEIDALKTMGFDPAVVLLLPRVLVLMIALPVLTFVGSLAALCGAGLVATTYAGMTPDMFLDRLNEAITMDHFLVGLIKAPFIGVIIGIIACVEGLNVQGSATSLGHHTTQSVVKSIFMVIVLDGLFALFFSAIRM